MKKLDFKLLSSEHRNFDFLRFVVVGILNSALTYALYVLLNMVLAYQVAYAISFSAGIFFSAQLNSKFTFKTKLNTWKLARFCFIYFLNFCVGLGLLSILVDYLQWSDVTAPVLVLLATTPIGFLGSKYVLVQKFPTHTID